MYQLTLNWNYYQIPNWVGPFCVINISLSFQHPDTADASQTVTVVAKATSKIKGFVYLLADIVGPATLLQDNLAELHVPIRSGNTPHTKHPYTIRNHLNAVFAHPQTLADIGISSRHTVRTL